MRFTLALVVVLLVAACSGDDSGRNTNTTERPVTTRGLTTGPGAVLDPGPTTTTSTVPAPDADTGSESIGVTDKVTIVITDPED